MRKRTNLSSWYPELKVLLILLQSIPCEWDHLEGIPVESRNQKINAHKEAVLEQSRSTKYYEKNRGVLDPIKNLMLDNFVTKNIVSR